MQELIEQLTAKAGITGEQATKSIEVMKTFVKEKFPMLGSAVDNMFGEKDSSATNIAAEPAKKGENNSVLDKISDVIPGQIGEKVEDFAKGIGDKISGIFGK